MMRELDTVSPVVWPAWCYSGGQPESESSGAASADVLQPRPQLVPPSASSMASSSSSSLRPSAAALGGGASAHRKRRSVPRSYDSPTTALNGARSSVKSERLSPSGSVHGVHDSASTSSLSRSGTPSSPPASGHPAGASPAASPSRSTSNNNTTTLNNNNISSHLKAMEDSVTHNYSEFMRNLAAKYQYVHPDEFYSATRNGFPAALDPRFPYKAGAMAGAGFLMPPLGPLPGVPGVPGVPPGVVSPLHHLAAPVSAPPPPAPKDSAPATSSRSSAGSGRSAASERERDRDREERDPAATNHGDDRAAPHKPTAKSPPSSAASITSAVSDSATSLLFSPLFSGALPGSLPGALPGQVPVMDMSSTQALVNMVQRSHQNQLETYLKGAIKRPAETSPSPLSPLDLSSAGAAPPKKSRKRDGGDLYGVDALLGLPSSLIRSSKERLATRTPPSRALSSPRLAATPAAPASPGQTKGGNPLSCSALCSTTPGHATAEGPCSTEAGAASISHWSVGDVCNFVGSIDLCVEYVQAFRDQRIDGSALPLLTEEHLRTQMKMRLGPALKLRAVLAKRLGHCSVCLHCVHCHNLPPSSTASATTSTATAAAPASPQSASGTAASTSTSPAAAGSPPPARPSSASLATAAATVASLERSAAASPKPTSLAVAPRPSSTSSASSLGH